MLMDVEGLHFHAKNEFVVTSAMNEVFFNVSSQSRSQRSSSFSLSSNSVLNVTAVEGVALYSNSSVSIESNVGLELTAGVIDVGGVLRVVDDELVAGGLLLNSLSTVLSGTAAAPLVLRGEKISANLNNEEGAVFSNSKSNSKNGEVHLATGKQGHTNTSPLIELVQGGGGDVVLSFVSNNATSALMTFGTPSKQKPISGSLEFHYGGEAHVKKGGEGKGGSQVRTAPRLGAKRRAAKGEGRAHLYSTT